MTFTEKEKTLIKNLVEILNLGTSFISGKSFNKKGVNEKQFTLFLNFGGVHCYSEAILTLCKDFRATPAIVLLRSIYENYANTLYILGSKKKIGLYAIEAIKNKVALANEITNFLKKYPHWPRNGIFSDIPKLEEHKKQQEEDIEEIRKHLKISPSTKLLDGLKDRAIEIDKKTISKKKKGYAEYNYIILYRYFSPYAHLNAAGVDGLITRLPSGEQTFHVSRSKEHLGEVLITTFVFYLDYLENLKKYKLIPANTSLTKFKRMFQKARRMKNI